MSGRRTIRKAAVAVMRAAAPAAAAPATAATAAAATSPGTRAARPRAPRLAAVAALLVAALAAAPAAPAAARATAETVVRVGAKNFTEQEILGELVAQAIERRTELEVERRLGLGGTDICHAALLGGELDVYVEYTGTALLNVLRRPVIPNPWRAHRTVTARYLDRFDLAWLPPIGFDNTYCLAVRRADAEANDWWTISDLAGDAGGLRAGFTAEFMERPDGLPGLAERYELAFDATVDLEPGLMYGAVAAGQVDVIGAFATDGRIAELDLVVLEDDRDFFPPYDAAPVVRGELLDRHPEVRAALAVLAGTIDDAEMRRLNAMVDVDGREPAAVAAAWLDEQLGGGDAEAAADAATAESRPGTWTLAVERRAELGRKTIEHLVLTLLGTGIAVAIGVPLGILVHRTARARGPVLAAIEVVQTIPSLAMLAFLFAVYGLLGTIPAVTALVLYALLPIVLNTFTGLREVPRGAIEAAEGCGLSPGQRLREVELPLAAPVIMAGIRAATVLTVGIATLSTYIGAGGLGDFIARGLARNDPRLTLLGAVPAAIMAVTLSLGLRGLERLAKRTR